MHEAARCGPPTGDGGERGLVRAVLAPMLPRDKFPRDRTARGENKQDRWCVIYPDATGRERGGGEARVEEGWKQKQSLYTKRNSEFRNK